ncbi:DnaJ family domain-containing protein [Paucibacter soli]|uniref:DnaJ family domain-containing protein n=1 Tax=Paucibacter soli TaxID=3133433 RepID=UPI0030B2F1F1
MQDDEIALHLEQARKSGELRQAESFGKPLDEDFGYLETPEGLRMPFKILKNAGFVPPEVERLRERAALADALRGCVDPVESQGLQQRLSELEQAIALRLEALRISGSL